METGCRSRVWQRPPTSMTRSSSSGCSWRPSRLWPASGPCSRTRDTTRSLIAICAASSGSRPRSTREASHPDRDWASGAGRWSAAPRGCWRTGVWLCAMTGLASSSSRCCRARASSGLQHASRATSENRLLGTYTKDLLSSRKTAFDINFSDPKIAQQIATKVESDYAAGKDGSLAIEDGVYSSKAIVTEYNKYMLAPSLTDAMMTLYNNVGKILREKYPSSKAKIGGMAYVNVTLPPKRVKYIEPNVVMWIAPIDIDPNHGMDDPKSPPRHEYRAMMYHWAELLNGRLAVYDYDQGMMIWRDMPNPSQHAFAQDVKHYAKAGILGIGTESRGATATTFLNLFFRGQLMWDPKADVEGMLAEFYPKFYGPAAVPAAKYWGTLFAAWR